MFFQLMLFFFISKRNSGYWCCFPWQHMLQLLRKAGQNGGVIKVMFVYILSFLFVGFLVLHIFLGRVVVANGESYLTIRLKKINNKMWKHFTLKQIRCLKVCYSFCLTCIPKSILWFLMLLYDKSYFKGCCIT